MKVFKNIRYFLICFVIIFLEFTVGKYLAVQGSVPMLSFCLCMVVGAKEKNPNYIVSIGIIMGVFFDLLSGHGFGSYTVTFTLGTLVTYIFRDKIFSSKILFLICDAFVLSVCLCIFYYLFHILDVGINFGLMFKNIAVPTAIYNTITSVVFYWILSPNLYKRR